jgi:membrane AbrB-like protein
MTACTLTATLRAPSDLSCIPFPGFVDSAKERPTALHQPLASISAAAKRHTMVWRVLEALAIGACGGALFDWLGMPAGFLSGSMAAVGIFALSGRQLAMPQSFAHVTMAILGMTLGSAATPEMMHGMAAYPISIALLALGTFVIALASTLYLRYVHGWTMLSALLGAAPGALSQAVAIALETRSDEVGVAIVQTLRVVLLSVFLPMGLAFAGMSVSGGGMSRLAVADATSLPLLVGVSVVVGYLFYRTRFPGGWLFGAMLGSTLLHAFGIVKGGLPIWVVSVAMVGMGAMVGTRLGSIGLDALKRYLLAGIGSLAVAMALMCVFVVLTVWLAGVPIQDTTMAFAPGAMDVMMAVALTLHLDPIFVGAHHLFRFVGVALLMPLIVRSVAPRTKEIPENEI